MTRQQNIELVVAWVTWLGGRGSKNRERARGLKTGMGQLRSHVAGGGNDGRGVM